MRIKQRDRKVVNAASNNLLTYSNYNMLKKDFSHE